MKRPVLDRIRERSEITDSGCWIWQGGTAGGGYGRIRLMGKSVMVHRAAWEAVNGPIPPGLYLDHFVCSTPLCGNPDHVRPVTPLENSLRSETSAAAVNTAKTHCPQGHPYDEANTHYAVRGTSDKRQYRECRICRAETRRRYLKRRAASAVPRPSCSVEGCERPSVCRGWCNMHHHRWRRWGSTDRRKAKRRSA